MSTFDDAIGFVLANEGGVSNNPDDPGGLTNFGISQRQYPTLNIRDLTKEGATAIYQQDYWSKFRYADIASQRVATKLFDAVVNMGPVPAVRLMQLALGAIEAGPIVADGILGQNTVESINAADEGRLIDEYKTQLVLFYVQRNKPEFLKGWIRRALKG